MTNPTDEVGIFWAAAEALTARGVIVQVSVPDQGSPMMDHHYIDTQEDLALFLRDQVGYWCELYGATREEYYSYAEYREDNCFAPRCGALTKSGARCKATGRQHYMCLGEWADMERRGWYCFMHGGERKAA